MQRAIPIVANFHVVMNDGCDDQSALILAIFAQRILVQFQEPEFDPRRGMIERLSFAIPARLIVGTPPL